MGLPAEAGISPNYTLRERSGDIPMGKAWICLLAAGLAGILAVSPSTAGGILPDRVNKIIIQGRFAEQAPAFLLIFSAQPLRDARGQLIASMSQAELAQLKNHGEQLAIQVYGKQASRPGQFEYAFGTAADAAMPWNDGRGFRWQDWEKHSPDIWDHLCVLSLPKPGGAPTLAVIENVALFKGGKALYDSRTRQSYPNKRPFDASFKPFDAAPRQARHPVLNLAGLMEQFRRDYYELDNNRVLNVAYSDLGQTEKRKYANRGNAWCSEFSSYVYRQCGIMTPDPNRSDVHWKSMRAFFEQNGQVFPAREVAGWSDQKKRATIKPGSFVSILIGDSTHSIIFTTWAVEPGQPVTRYVGISGNNKGMVWPHAPMRLPTPDQLAALTPEELREYDQKVYFAVPR
jgi:hypothetical protein